MSEQRRTEVDARFGPVLDALDVAVKPFDLNSGENIYMITVWLFGCIEDIPVDVRELFRNAIVQLLLMDD